MQDFKCVIAEEILSRHKKPVERRVDTNTEKPLSSLPDEKVETTLIVFGVVLSEDGATLWVRCVQEH